MIEKKRRFFIQLVSRIVSFCLLIQATVLIFSLYACGVGHNCWHPSDPDIPKEIRTYDTSITVEQHVATLTQRLDDRYISYYEAYARRYVEDFGTSGLEEELEKIRTEYKVYPIYSFDGYAEYFLVTRDDSYGDEMLTYCDGEYYTTQSVKAEKTLWGALGILDDPNYTLYCYYDFFYGLVYTGYGKTDEPGKIWATDRNSYFYYSSDVLSERDVEWALEKNLVHNSWDCWCLKNPEYTHHPAFKDGYVGPDYKILLD